MITVYRWLVHYRLTIHMHVFQWVNGFKHSRTDYVVCQSMCKRSYWRETQHSTDTVTQINWSNNQNVIEHNRKESAVYHIHMYSNIFCRQQYFFHLVWVNSLCDPNILFARSSEIRCMLSVNQRVRGQTYVYPSIQQTTSASASSHESSQTVPHSPW